MIYLQKFKKHQTNVLKNSTIILQFLVILFFVSCNSENSDGGYAARVEDTYLSEEEVNKSTGSDTLLRNYYVKNWIETEVFYKQGLEDNISEDEELGRILENSKKEVIKSYIIKKLLEERELNPSDEELEDFYKLNKDAFKVHDDAFILDVVVFNSKDIAARFREMVLSFNWENASKTLGGDKSVIKRINSEVLYDYQVSSGNFARILELMNEGEVSLIFQENPGSYSVAMVKKKLRREDIPELEYIKNDVKKLFIETKNREYIDEYTKNLYSKFDIEIREKRK